MFKSKAKMDRTQRKTISREILHQAVTTVGKRLDYKLKKKGMYAWESTHEVYGFMAEEVHELLIEMHGNNLDNFELELQDIAVTAIFGLASIKTLKANGVY